MRLTFPQHQALLDRIGETSWWAGCVDKNRLFGTCAMNWNEEFRTGYERFFPTITKSFVLAIWYENDTRGALYALDEDDVVSVRGIWVEDGWECLNEDSVIDEFEGLDAFRFAINQSSDPEDAEQFFELDVLTLLAP